MTALSRGLLSRASLPLVVAICWATATVIDAQDIDQNPIYPYVTSLLLIVGLYGSTYSIDREELRGNRKRVGLAITLGVLLKAAFIGSMLWLVMGEPIALILGIAVAQIDPLAVASLMNNDRLSARVKAILASWSSFDDPVTVIIALYATLFAHDFFGLSTPNSHSLSSSHELLSYSYDIGANLLFAGIAIAVWSLLKRWPYLQITVVVIFAGVAVWQFLALGVAIAGLVVRPPIFARIMPIVTRGALLIAAGLLGALLTRNIDVVVGMVLGILAFAAQIGAGFAFSRGLPRADRIHLAFAQQNGITAIILSLRMETQYPGIVAVVGPAIVMTNCIHYIANRLIDREKTAIALAEKVPVDH